MTNKEKLIAEAQKLLQKGQLDKSIKCYQDAVALEPGDLKTRQRLAELLARAERSDDARAEFEVIGKSLSGNGFYLRAIAVYKQIERLAPDDVGVILTLASLNEKHGLVGQAMAEYKRAFDLYEKKGEMVEAIGVLVSMEKADPQNTNIRLKLSEVLYQSGHVEESFQAFCELAGMLVERGDESSFTRLVSRIEQIFPDRSGFVYDILQKQVESGNINNALQILHSLLKSDPRNMRVWTIILTAYEHQGDETRLKTASQHFIRFFPEQFLPRKHLASCLISENDVDGALSQLESAEQLAKSPEEIAGLKELYTSLSKVAPYDVKVLKGLARLCNATGDKDQADAISSKIVSLSNIASSSALIQPEEPEFLPFDVEEQPEEPIPDILEDAGICFAEEPREELSVSGDIETADDETLEYGEVRFGVETDEAIPVLEAGESELSDYEIEIDLDMDEEPVQSQVTGNENWFDTVNDIFDNIVTEPGKVKVDGMEQGDSQSHYDLGMAFREMGLLDEAINEFRTASSDPQRKVECMIQQAGCLRDKGELELAENALTSLFSAPGLFHEERTAIKYELALTFEAGGQAVEATRLYNEIEAETPEFRDVRSRLEKSSADAGASSFDFSEDELLDFDLK